MAIFTAIASALLAGTFLAGTIAVPVLAAGLGLAASMGISYAVRALSGNAASAQSQDSFGMQGQIAAGGAVPRSFPLGSTATAGSLTYVNYHNGGLSASTPNAFLTYVIALSDVPGCKLSGLWINGEKCTFTIGEADAGLFAADSAGFTVPEFFKVRGDSGSAVPHVWVRYYDGSQVAADPYVVGVVSSADRPYAATRVGVGVAYVVITVLENDKVFTGFPTFLFETTGVPLYDPSKDSTVGGSGSQVWSDRSTWGGDGDNLPAVQAYNVLRGITYAGEWVYGLQNGSAARLPVSNWITQIAKCRATILGESGLEPTYRAGAMIGVDTQPANGLEGILTACQGRLSEIGGFYKIHVGAPDTPTFAFSDDDILSTEEQVYRPFFALADSVNGIQAKYPDPAQAWQTATAPAYYRTDLEAHDGGRRLMASPSFDFVPYPAQVQRLQKSAIEEAQRARTHTIVLPPQFWLVEPGDVGEWTSVRNGYVEKQFRIDAIIDKANLDVGLSLTEVDPSDYDWTHATDFQPYTSGPTGIVYPAPQGVIAWFAEGVTLFDADGLARRPAIRVGWDGTVFGVIGVQYEIRLKSDASAVGKGRTDQVTAGALIISHDLIPATQYQVRGQYIPSAPRDMLWSDWLDVTTPDVRISLADLEAAIKQQVTTIQDVMNDKIDQITQMIAALSSNQDARNWTDTREVRSELSSRSDAAFAQISSVQSVLTAADAAMASEITTLNAEVATANANISTNATAIATLNSSYSSYQTTVNAHLGSLDSSIGSLNSSVSTNSTAIATLNGYAAAAYSVTLDVNGYATGFNLVNGGPGVSAAIFTVDKFQIAKPGVAGGAPAPIFTIANVGGAPKVALRSDMIIDGSITATMMTVGTLSAITANLGTVTAGKIQSPSGQFVIDADNQRIEIWS